MSEYYGVSTPTSDFLAHYGIKGMKWGVRKAIESGNRARLDRHYARASKKLQTLMARSDKELISQAKKKNISQTIGNTAIGGLGSGAMTYAINNHLPAAERLKWSAIVGGAAAGANALAGGINQARLARWGSNSGNAKMVAKRKAWEKEMRSTFKGTPYAKQINRTKSNIARTISIAKNAENPARNLQENRARIQYKKRYR